VRRVKLPKGRKLVALTFDLCEVAHQVAGYDGAIVDYLRAHNVKATFFAGGKWMLSHLERAEQLMADDRFEVGTHGWAHINLRVARGRVVTDEILGATAAYDITRKALSLRKCVKDESVPKLAHVPELPKVFRFPFGACHAGAMKEVAKAGLFAIQWDVSTGDPSRNASARSIARAVLTEAKPGSIIIAHANGRGWNTAKALPLFVPEMRKQGYEFVTVSELMAAGTPEIATTCYDRRPGDTNRYDVVRLRRKYSRKRSKRKSSASAHNAWPAFFRQ
jgi:peptidoglycan/xylan/chitin deacetylase (PgdA/CDA1 family)